MYLFLLDVSHNAIQTGNDCECHSLPTMHTYVGYLQSFCDILSENLDELPGDARTKIGFLTYDARIHFYDLSDRHNGTFRTMIATDLSDVEAKPEDIISVPDGLMVTLSECRSIVENFLTELPRVHQNNRETDSALGAALLIARKLLQRTGGRMTIFQTRLPNIKPGDLNAPAAKEATTVAPSSDFYKQRALELAQEHIACDLFMLNSHYADLATLSMIVHAVEFVRSRHALVLGGISKHSGGEVKYYPNFHVTQAPDEVERFKNDLKRYLQRKIGFEAVMRLRTPPGSLLC